MVVPLTNFVRGYWVVVLIVVEITRLRYFGILTRVAVFSFTDVRFEAKGTARYTQIDLISEVERCRPPTSRQYGQLPFDEYTLAVLGESDKVTPSATQSNERTIFIISTVVVPAYGTFIFVRPDDITGLCHDMLYLF